MTNWYFPFGFDIEKESVNNARIETFKDNILESLARETCQNSLDAASSEAEVYMTFEEKSVNLRNLINKDIFIDEIIPKALETWKGDKKSQDFLIDFRNILLNDTIRVLKISDYNTTGLEDKNWSSLIENAGISVKHDIGSAGSFGIGKAAPFASSDLRMVFYSTKTLSNKEKSIGVCKFVSFENEDGSIAQGVGYLGADKKLPNLHQIDFGFKTRTTPGTDLYIIGFNQGRDWKNNIVKSLLNNFLLSIYKEKLSIKVEDILINKSTMGEIIKSFKGKNSNELKNYYSVLENIEKGLTKKILLDERFKEFGFSPNDGVLLISEGENANRSVLMTRKAGMKILDKKNISGSIQFNGIFQATGDKFNEILKEMENPNHNTWSSERYRKNPVLADKLLKSTFRFMKENILNEFQEKIEKQVDAFGMSDFLPDRISGDCSSKNVKDSLEEEVISISLSKYTSKKKKELKDKSVDIVDEDNRIKGELVDDGIIEFDGDNLENIDGYCKGRDNRKSKKIEKELKGSKKSFKELPLKNKSMKFKKMDHKIKYRIIEKDYRNGEYYISLKPLKNINLLKIEINVVGENGSLYTSEVIEAKQKNQDIEYKNNYFFIENMRQNEFESIQFKIKYNQRVKMEAQFYENK